MNFLPDSLVNWVIAALLLFWFVGAYNRLMRLRTAALQGYATLDAAMVRQLDFVQAEAAAAREGMTESSADDASTRASLEAATVQLGTLLATTRVRPLDPERVAALGTALQVLFSAWQRQHPDSMVSFDADGMLSRPVPLGGVDEQAPANLPIAWPEPSAAAEIARSQFNGAVAAYNAAIRQFPALFVAWLMRLRSAAPLL